MNNTKFIFLSTVIIVSLMLALPEAKAQSLSDTFVDSVILRSDGNTEPTSTLLQIETALTTGSLVPDNQFDSLFSYLSPLITFDDEFLDRVIIPFVFDSKDNPVAQENSTSVFSALQRGEYQKGLFLQIQPALDRLEREGLEGDDDVPAYASGAAMYALTSLIRYGACLELINTTIEGTAQLDSDGNTVDICEVPRLGKIRAWEFDPDRLSGSLFVHDMKVDRYTFRYDNSEGVIQSNLIEQWSYDWLVEIKDKGYVRAKRLSQRDFLNALQNDPNADPFVDVDQSNDPNQVRPALPDQAKDFINPNGIWGRGLTGRLFAYGENVAVKSVTGTRYAMRIASGIEEETTYVAINGTEYVRDHVLEGNVVFGSDSALLKPSEGSCIDIMFALPQSGKFPQTIHDFPPTQRGWCLGRCMSPMIANSR